MGCYHCSVLVTSAAVVCVTNTLIWATHTYTQFIICDMLHVHYRVLEGSCK